MSPEDWKNSPIHGTDFSKPLSHVIEDVRVKLADARGNLLDIERAYPAWRERVDHAAGALTCVISALYTSMQEIAEHEKARTQ